MERLADLALRRARTVVVAVLALSLVMGVYGAGAFHALKIPKFTRAAEESTAVADRVRSDLGRTAEPDLLVLVERDDDGGLTTAGAQAEIRRLTAVLEADPAVGLAVPPSAETGLLSPDGRSGVILGHLDTLDEDDGRAATERVRPRLESDVVDVRVGGRAAAFSDTATQAETDIFKAEGLAFPVLTVLMIFVFGGVVAALVPLSLAMVSVLASLAGLRLLGEVVPISVSAVNVVSALGLGLAVDYSLFLVSRFREELAHDPDDPARAMRTTLATAGRTVVYSAVTVAVALSALCLFPQRFIYSMGLGGVFVSLFVAATALVLIPALLLLLGPRLDRLAVPRRRRAGPASRLGETVRTLQQVPLLMVVLAVGALTIYGIPALDMRTTSVGPGVLPTSTESGAVEQAIRAAFPGAGPGLIVEVDHGGDRQVLAAATQELGAVPGVVGVRPPTDLPQGRSLLLAQTGPDPYTDVDASRTLVGSARAIDVPGARVRVGGEAAALVDLRADVTNRLPLVVAFLVLTTTIALIVLTGSLLLPLVSVALNGLTIFATMGILVLIFQDGRLEGLLSFESQDALFLFSGLLVGSMAFGLATDYGVFLLARIRELRDTGMEDDEAVRVGVQRTGGLIAAAGLLFCVAIGSIATSPLIFLKEFAIGNVIAVMIDATLVRPFLLPAIIKLLGPAAWWAPARLQQLTHRLEPGVAATPVTGTAGP